MFQLNRVFLFIEAVVLLLSLDAVLFRRWFTHSLS
jgi:hypothetical protein